MAGTLRGLLRREAEIGFTCIEAMTPVPVGDLPVEEWKDDLEGSDVIAWGGIPGAFFSDNVSDAEFDEFAIRVLAVMKQEHRWQETNPVTTEGLIQLISGAPQPICNGGLLFARLAYFDTHRQRLDLPQDVAALVEKLEAKRTVLHLVNLNPIEGRELILQAGAFGEYRFSSARYSALTSEFPGVRSIKLRRPSAPKP